MFPSRSPGPGRRASAVSRPSPIRTRMFPPRRRSRMPHTPSRPRRAPRPRTRSAVALAAAVAAFVITTTAHANADAAVGLPCLWAGASYRDAFTVYAGGWSFTCHTDNLTAWWDRAPRRDTRTPCRAPVRTATPPWDSASAPGSPEPRSSTTAWPTRRYPAPTTSSRPCRTATASSGTSRRRSPRGRSTARNIDNIPGTHGDTVSTACPPERQLRRGGSVTTFEEHA